MEEEEKGDHCRKGRMWNEKRRKKRRSEGCYRLNRRRKEGRRRRKDGRRKG